jgi:hypothetical protein
MPMPKMGPWRLTDEFGAVAATIMVTNSMDPGVMETMVQLETVRKMKSTFVNSYKASVENESSSVIFSMTGGAHLSWLV